MSAVRVAFLLSLLLSGGVAVVVYLALWIAMPLEPDAFGRPPPWSDAT